MNSTMPTAHAQWRLRLAIGAVVLTFIGAALGTNAQGLVPGVQQGAQAGSRAAGPVGGVLGGAIGGVVGAFTGVLGVGKSGQPPAANGAKAGSAKMAKAAKQRKGAKPVVLIQEDEPQLSAEQIVVTSDANIEVRLSHERGLE
jgi:hypothetical protein